MHQQATKLNPGQTPSILANTTRRIRRRIKGQTNPYHDPYTDDRCTACATVRWAVVGLVIWVAIIGYLSH